MLKEIKILTLLAVCGLASGQKRQLYGNPDGIVFPPGIIAQSSQPKSSTNGLTVQLAKTINSMNNFEEFLNMVDKVPEELHHVVPGSIFNDEERSNAIVAKQARCMPELQPVSFFQGNPDPSIVYYPSCTRIKRCGGCCHHPLLSCQPNASVTQNYQVLVTKVNSQGGLTYSEKQIIPMEEHTKCKCDCRIKPEHCTGKQEYVEEECICRCSNVDEEEKCRRLTETKLWDPTLCTCRCRDEQGCQQETPFSSRWDTTYKEQKTSRSRDSSQPVIVPLDSNNRRRQNKDDPEYK